MGHINNMIGRLPQLYRDGELVGQMLALPGLQLEILDEDGLEVQRAHWFDAALELEEADRLAALLDITPESWQSLDEFRAWVHSFRDARLLDGAVTIEALRGFVESYTKRYQQVVNIMAVPAIESWVETSIQGEASFVENPPQKMFARAPVSGGLEPLHQFEIIQRGLDATAAGFLLVGLPEAPESVPVIVNVTSGEAIIFKRNLPPGQRLWIRPQPDGTVTGHLEREDVSAHLYSVSGIVPGQPWSPGQISQPAQAITLHRGKNQMWFLPLAHYDALGLDRFLLALPDLLLRQGRYDQTNFDEALFYQHPAAILRVTWVETSPAKFSIQLPGGLLRFEAGESVEALNQRERLSYSLNLAVGELKAAGVSSEVQLRPWQETQPQMDYLTARLPQVLRETGPTGADTLPDAGGLFSVTEFDQSTFS